MQTSMSQTPVLRPYSSASVDDSAGASCPRTTHETAAPPSMKSHPVTERFTPWSVSTGKCGAPVLSGALPSIDLKLNEVRSSVPW